MKIGIDISPLYSEKIMGIGNYTKYLLEGFSKLKGDVDFNFLCFSSLKPALHKKLKKLLMERLPPKMNFNISFIPFPYKFQSLLQFVPIEFFIHSKIDIFHSPYQFFSPLSFKYPLVSTIHDVYPLMNPELTTGKGKQYFEIKKSYNLVAQRADTIITVSERAKKDIVNKLEIPAEKIEVIYHGVEKNFFRPLLNKEVLEKYGINKKYILYVGAIAPLKNLVKLVLSFSKIRENFECQLVLVGALSREYNNLFTLIENLPENIKKDILLTGYTRKDLPYLYSHAEVFVLPSLYESFGLPVLEAMSCGCPVVISNGGALPEITGDAAILVNPNDEISISNAISRVMDDIVLRKKLKEKGAQRANFFSWEKTAEKTLNVYAQTISKRRLSENNH